MTKPRTAIVYARISDDATSEQAGVERQRKDCERFCRERGWDVFRVVTDNDLSASRYARKARPGYGEALAALKAGSADALVAWHVDRLYRQPRELEDLIDLAEKRDIAVATLHGDLNLQSGDGRAFARILVTMAAKGSDDTSRRVRRVREEEARAGVPHGGTRTFGYRADMTIEPAEARLLRQAAKRVLAGGSATGIVREWNEKGVATVKGSQWHSTTLRQMLVNPKLAGLRVHHGEVVATGTWSPIFDRQTHEQLKRLFADGRRRKGVPANVGLLTGFARCGICGQGMTRDQGKLRCKAMVGRSNCGRVVIVEDKTQQVVTEALLAALDGPGLAAAQRGHVQAESADAMAAVLALEADLEALAGDLGAGRITRREWLAARSGIEQRLEDARRALPNAKPNTALDGLADIRKQWPRLGLERQRAVLGAVVDRIVIAPATKLGRIYDPNRVSITWRA